MKGHTLQIAEVFDRVRAVTFHHVIKQNNPQNQTNEHVQAENMGNLNCVDVHMLLSAAVGDFLVLCPTKQGTIVSIYRTKLVKRKSKVFRPNSSSLSIKHRSTVFAPSRHCVQCESCTTRWWVRLWVKIQRRFIGAGRNQVTLRKRGMRTEALESFSCKRSCYREALLIIAEAGQEGCAWLHKSWFGGRR